MLYLLPQIAKFPRSERYLLGERLELLCFDVLELFLNACYSHEKVSILQQTNIRLERARYYVKLCKDLKLINIHKYEVISKMINEIGIQLGGWIKQQRG